MNGRGFCQDPRRHILQSNGYTVYAALHYAKQRLRFCRDNMALLHGYTVYAVYNIAT